MQFAQAIIKRLLLYLMLIPSSESAICFEYHASSNNIPLFFLPENKHGCNTAPLCPVWLSIADNNHQDLSILHHLMLL